MAEAGKGALSKLWSALARPSARYSVLALLVVGFAGGIVFWGGFHTAMEATNTLAFCTSCHEMEQTVFQEYKKTIHYSNPRGVRATCSDCHVPKEWGPKVVRKIQATNELFHKVMGTIDTPEKFEAQRAAMAERVWDGMKKTDSRECRNCHSLEAMDLEPQKPRARNQHQAAKTEKQTCIECHQGIAHKLPEKKKG
jgi:cytochrome c-type protein NapC